MKQKVSMIILSYKNIAGIYETLDSIFEQTYENIEIVISDDGTKEFKSEIEKLEEYIINNKKENITNYVINAIEVNGGTVKNINSAISRSTGKYIKVLSAEDTFSKKEALSEYVEFIEKEKVLIAFAKMRGVTPAGEYKYELLSCESDYDLLKSLSVEQTKNRLFKRNFLPAPAWITDRELFEKVGLFKEDTRLIEDYPYWIYLCLNNVKFGYLDEVLIDYKLSGVSSAGSYSEMFMNDMFVIYEKYIFPYDRRYKIFQPVYNMLKKAGLNYYMSQARKSKMTKGKRMWCAIKYLPFHMLVTLQNVNNNRKNKKINNR